MTVRNLGGAILGLMLVLMASCDDNPLAEERDKAAYFRLNPVDVGVNAGGSVLVEAIVVNQYGAATNASVTGTPCDNKITAEADTARSAYEFPERFRVTGVTLGVSCLIVRGGGLTDTVKVRVVPASIQLVGVDSLLSGNTSNVQVRFLNVAGQPVTGLAVSDVTLASGNTSIIAVTPTGGVTAMAPGTTTITATLSPTLGVTRTGTANVRVVPGTFAGTVAQATYQGGHALVLTAASSLPFDADTEVRLRSPFQPWYSLAPTTATTARALLPFGLPAGTVVGFDVVNLGPGQVAQGGSFTLTQATPAEDTLEPDPLGNTLKTMTPGTDFFGSITVADDRDRIRVEVTQQGTYTLNVQWNDGSDIDVYVRNTAGASLLSRETLANPETGTVTLAPGTYYIDVWLYDKTGTAPATYRARLTRN